MTLLARQPIVAVAFVLLTLNGCNDAMPVERFSAGTGPAPAADGAPGVIAPSESQEEDAEKAPEGGESIAAPVPVGGAYLWCEIDLNAVVPNGMSHVGCVVKDRESELTIDFAADYSSKLEVFTAGVAAADVTVTDATATPSPYHWRFMIPTDRLVASTATVILTNRMFPDRITTLQANLPPFAGTEIRTRLGFNFDDTGADGSGDRDFNDVVMCMNGEFRLSLSDKLLVSQSEQTASLTYQRNADCSQDIEVQYTTPGTNVINIFLDSVDRTAQTRTFSLQKGTRLQIKFKSAAPCISGNVDLFNNASVRLRAEACGRVP